MPLASSSAVVVRAIKENVFGQIPVAGDPTELRITGETLKFNITKESSQEINMTRAVSSVIPVTANSSGGITSEVYANGLDALLESVLQGLWVNMGASGETGNVTASFAAGTITAGVAPTGNDAFTRLQPGQWFRVKGAGTNADAILRVHPTTVPTSTVITLDPNTPAQVSAGEVFAIQSARLTHGINQTSWTLERENVDIGVFTAYRGMTPSSFSMEIASGSLSSISFEFMGKNGFESDTTLLPGTTIPSPAAEIHSGVSGATTAVWENGVPITDTYVKSVTIDFNNTLRSQEAIGHLGAVGIGSGTIECTITVQVYFANKTLFEKFRRNINSSFIFSSTDDEGNGYILTLPKVNVTDFTSNASAKDQDQMLDLTCTALLDKANPLPGLRKLLFIDRVGAPTVIPNSAPFNTILPVITGTAAEGQVLTATQGSWTGYPAPTYAYAWLRNGVAIGGATVSTYTLVAGDVGNQISVQVTATNTEGSVYAVSLETAVVSGTLPVNTVAPAVTGTAEDGEVLTTTNGTWTGTAPITYAIEWLRDNVVIAGESGTTYTLTGTDVGTKIRSRITATNAAGSATEVSAETAPVAP